MKYEWFIGLRYLKAKRKQNFISVITGISIAGVMIGVTALIVVLAVMSGFDKTLEEKILGTQSDMVILRAGQQGMDNYDEVIQEVERVKGVVSASPFIAGQAMLSTASHVSGVVLEGIDPNQASRVTKLASYLIAGHLRDLQETRNTNSGIILGVELARRLSVSPGETVQAVSPGGNMTPMGILPKLKRFRVVGLFRSGMYDFDSTLTYVSLKSAQQFFDMGSRVTGIEVKTDEIYKVNELGNRIRRKLGLPFLVRNWMEMNRNLFSALRLEKIAMFIILVLIVLVAAFNIISTLIMVVMEKNRDIAILKTMGAPSRGILKIFIIEGLVVGLVGTVLGTIFGLIIAFNLEKITGTLENLLGFKFLPSDVYQIDRLPSQVNPSDVAWIVVISLFISFLATIYPSWRASKIDPAEILRYE
jgi:lipoprotein-releasing system permease protein